MNSGQSAIGNELNFYVKRLNNINLQKYIYIIALKKEEYLSGIYILPHYIFNIYPYFCTQKA